MKGWCFILLFNVKINNFNQTMHGDNFDEVLKKIISNNKYKNSKIEIKKDSNKLSALIYSSDGKCFENIYIRKKL